MIQDLVILCGHTGPNCPFSRTDCHVEHEEEDAIQAGRRLHVDMSWEDTMTPVGRTLSGEGFFPTITRGHVTGKLCSSRCAAPSRPNCPLKFRGYAALLECADSFVAGNFQSQPKVQV
ncbi:hypothetical protein VTO73DRAFT_10857 [Trametes versicolor]